MSGWNHWRWSTYMRKRRQSNLTKSLISSLWLDHASLISCARMSCFCRVIYFFILKFSLVMSCDFSIMSLASGGSAPGPRSGTSVPQTPCSASPLWNSWIRHWFWLSHSYLYAFCLLLYHYVWWIMMTVVIESDHVVFMSASNMWSDWFFLVLTTFWQMIHCSLQTKTNKKAVLWQGNRTYDVIVKFDTYRYLQRHRAVLQYIISVTNKISAIR